jgi:hypothetical protein
MSTNFESPHFVFFLGLLLFPIFTSKYSSHRPVLKPLHSTYTQQNSDGGSADQKFYNILQNNLTPCFLNIN